MVGHPSQTANQKLSDEALKTCFRMLICFRKRTGPTNTEMERDRRNWNGKTNKMIIDTLWEIGDFSNLLLFEVS
jgi:hypothetical protein